MDRQIDGRAPQHRAGRGVQRRHGAIAGRDEDLAVADGHAAAEAAAARAAAEADAQEARTLVVLLDLDIGLPKHGAGTGVDGGDAGLAVQNEDLAVISHDRRHDLTGVAGADADVALPGDSEFRCGDDVFDRVLGVAAGLGPGRRSLRARQEEVTTRQSG
ncbi:hypothetical protein D3C72_1395410 [compost metagenome]